MKYIIQPGDTLWRIAARQLGDAEKWRQLVEDNPGVVPAQLIVGDALILRDAMPAPEAWRDPASAMAPPSAAEQRASLIPARAFLFVLADEWDPRRRKVVRRVLVNPRLAAAWAARLGKPMRVFPDPEVFGFLPTDSTSRLSPGRHALGIKPSPFSSASDRVLGATRFRGAPFWIDVEAAQASGATVHETAEIIADLGRIAAKTKNPRELARVLYIRRLVTEDAEVLVRGAIPGAAVQGAGARVATRLVQGVQVVGFVMTAVDLGRASGAAVQMGSVKPLAAEAIRQAGGWAAAWAGVKLGAAAGAALGIETGPGAVLTAAAGGALGGVAGYCGFDWIADSVYEN